jgi:hypothetical protein
MFLECKQARKVTAGSDFSCEASCFSTPDCNPFRRKTLYLPEAKENLQVIPGRTLHEMHVKAGRITNTGQA